MRLVVRLFVVAFVLATLPLGALAQGPPPPPPPPPPPVNILGGGAPKTGTARLAGRVTALDTGRPIRRAVVSASTNEPGASRSVSTDAEGRWELRDLPAGRFSVSVSKGGYVTLAYGQRRPFGTGKAIELADKQVLEKIDFALPRASAITGRVVDEFGDPMTGVRVMAMRYRFMNGQRRLTSASLTDNTDDLGQFRLYGLAPGDYFVVAQAPNFSPFLSASADRTGYAQTYYPNSYSPGEASKLTLSLAQEAHDIVVSMAPARVAKLSGTVHKADGKAITAGMVRLVEVNSGGPVGSQMGVILPNGTWTITGVVPGEYRLTAQVLERTFEEIGAGGGGIGAMQFANMPLTVTGDDVTGLALTVSAGGTAEGVVRFEGTPPAARGAATIAAIDISNTGLGGAGTVKPDGTFQIGGLFGQRLLRALGLPAGWTLKAVTLNGTDVTDTGIDVPPGGKVEGIEVLLTQKAAELSGTVQTAKGTATSDFVVMVFSPDADKWGFQSRYVRMARPDQTGRFVIEGLPAASYLAVALEYAEPGEEGNPEFLESLRQLATKVTIGEGEKKTVTLKIAAQ